jgi:hypothetical protein
VYICSGDFPRHNFHDRTRTTSKSKSNIYFRLSIKSIQHQSHTTNYYYSTKTTSKHHVVPSNPIRLHPQPRRPPNAAHPPRSRRVPPHCLCRATQQSQTHFGTRLLAVPQRLERLRVGVMNPPHHFIANKTMRERESYTTHTRASN